MMNHMLDPRIVGITGRRKAIFPADILCQLFLVPGVVVERRISRCYIKTKKIWAVKRQLGDGFVTLNCLYTTIFQLVSQQKLFIMSRLQNLCQLIAEAVMDVKPHACEYINAVYEEKHHLVIKLFGFEICPRGSCHSCKL